MEILLRKCPKCNGEIHYKTKAAFNKANLSNTNCPACSRKISNSLRKGQPSKLKGQTISKSSRKPKTIPITCGTCNEISLYAKMKTVTFCKRCSARKHSKLVEYNKQNGHPLKDTTFTEHWIKTLPEHEAKLKITNFKQKRSAAFTGIKNPQFGKPPKQTPVVSQGCNGYWFDLYFRSFYELSFLVWFKQTHGYLPQTAETAEFKIPLPTGKNYFPDFYDPNTQIVYEIKPFSKLNDPDNICKFNAAKNIFGEKFKVVTEKDFSLVYKTYTTLENLRVNRHPRC
ncbi:hypothetical protein [Acinetobacter sp.]|uniref:hypothetical protein n=1 Tax=Acinetobacter sp. TaxID=472 RepID=UPI003890D6D9